MEIDIHPHVWCIFLGHGGIHHHMVAATNGQQLGHHGDPNRPCRQFLCLGRVGGHTRLGLIGQPHQPPQIADVCVGVVLCWQYGHLLRQHLRAIAVGALFLWHATRCVSGCVWGDFFTNVASQ